MNHKFTASLKRTVMIGDKEVPVRIPVEVQVDLDILVRNLRVFTYDIKQKSDEEGISASDLTAGLMPEDIEPLEKCVLEDAERHLRSPIVFKGSL